MTTTKHIPSEDLKPGDSLVFLGASHRIREIRPYVGPLEDVVFATAIAEGGDWEIGLERDGTVEVAA